MLSWGVSNKIWSNRGVSDILIRFTNPVAAFKGGSGVSFKPPQKSFILPPFQIFMALKATFGASPTQSVKQLRVG